MQKLGFGGGCHWCTEAVFQALGGVKRVEQGFIAPPSESFSEAVVAHFDEGEISVSDLIQVHLATHASTAAHKMRGKYRSAIYAFDDAKMAEARAELAMISRDLGVEFVTQVLPFGSFKASDARFQNYYQSDPNRPFCQSYIEPKLSKLKAHHANLLKRAS